MNVKIIFISIITIITGFYVFKHTRNHNPQLLTCSAKYHLFLESPRDNSKIKGEVFLVFRIYSKTKGVVSEVGVVNVDGENYSINRSVTLRFIENGPDGYLSTQRVSVVKNQDDDLPEAITDLLMSKQTIFFYKIMPITSNIYGIRDLRRTLMICRAE